MLISIDWGSDLMSTMGKATMFSWTASEMGTGWAPYLHTARQENYIIAIGGEGTT